uniref:THAP domain-containing protein 1 n=1 Tax=Amphilophus citrinellus TaxID=61819 RepID=A0A3Q0T6E6_AMPCI
MPYHCVAYGCGKTTEDGVTLFKFPKDPEEFRKWEKQVQRTRTQWVATPNSYLCSEHFGKEYFEPRLPTGLLKLRLGAAPTVFLTTQGIKAQSKHFEISSHNGLTEGLHHGRVCYK